MYLLSGSTLLELAVEGNNVTKARVREVPAPLLRLSVVGVGMAREAIQSQSTGVERDQWLRALNHTIALIQLDAGRTLSVEEGVVAQWELIRSTPLPSEFDNDDGQPEDLAQDVRLVIASAMHYGLILLEPAQRYHEALRALSVRVEST